MKPSILLCVAALGLCACGISPQYEPDMRSETTTVMCHQQRQTLVLSDKDASQHLVHGDTYGACN
ncbi:hypothetical protein E4T66_02005 [Sinimarinibacterium sp. CAU 1509]|uniref:hypothetical protein n=1 Tax=Sinimarinibacterium sp. CAU 1509 TaxID=2562283 RepID=UPI0010AD5C87|nr:hypothetical protein [Sinimarinibacterium sp. CAU 1509]TJY65020.1 hypothetical protein E4T66_02005 [Sinimarinibacterium sp. CAU 1509]